MKRFILTLTALAVVSAATWFMAIKWNDAERLTKGPQTAVTYTFGDWIVRCSAVADSPECKMSQRLINGQTGELLAAIEVRYSLNSDAHQLSVLVPLNILPQPGAVLNTEDHQALKLLFRQCFDDGCVANTRLNHRSLSAFQSEGNAKLVLHDRYKGPLNLPVSMRGFKDASTRLKRDTSAIAESGNLTIAGWKSRAQSLIEAFAGNKEAESQPGR